MKTVIVLLCWNNHEEVISMAEQIDGWDIPDLSTVVVINDGTDLSNRLPTPTFWLLSDHNVGFSGGMNLGIKKAMEMKAQFVLLLNSDIRIEKQVVLDMIETMASKNSDAFSIGPIVRENYGRSHVGGLNIAYHLNTRMEENPVTTAQENNLIEVDYTIGTAIMLNISHLIEVGLFDENYFFSGEVADLCYRAQKKGLRSYSLSTSEIMHNNEGTSNPRSIYYSFRNRLYFIEKHNLPGTLIQKWIFQYLRQGFGALLSGRIQNVRAIYWAIRHHRGKTYGNQNHLFANNMEQ